MRKLSALLLFLFASMQISLAQQLKISGKVTDATGNPIDGATVNVKGTKTNAITNLQGMFTIKATKGQTLVISNIGFTEKEVAITTEYIEVQLVFESKDLQDVVVVGYGTQKKGKITGAIATINGDQLIRRPLANVSMGLQGMAPGVTVRQSSGQPGADGVCRHRHRIASGQGRQIECTGRHFGGRTPAAARRVAAVKRGAWFRDEFVVCDVRACRHARTCCQEDEPVDACRFKRQGHPVEVDHIGLSPDPQQPRRAGPVHRQRNDQMGQGGDCCRHHA